MWQRIVFLDPAWHPTGVMDMHPSCSYSYLHVSFWSVELLFIYRYADIFKGVGTLPGGPYHRKLKYSYKPVQHPPRSVPLGMQSAYKAELDRLVKEGIITEVHEHTEWINSIVPVMKEDGSLRLCLDPKDLKKAIKRNQWYARTLDDILPELAQSKYFTVKDATSRFWHILLDFRSSLLTTFNTLWGKYRWLRMPFGLEVSGDVFQGTWNHR